MRIHIIGGSGTGKSYISNLISNTYNIPHYDLDDIFWKKNKGKYGYGNKNDVDNRTKELISILSVESWVIEGVYFDWVEESFKQADHIIILYDPKWLCQLRIIKRFILRRLNIDNGQKVKLKGLLKLLKWNNSFENEKLPRILTLTQKYSTKTIVTNSRNLKKNYRTILGP